MGIYITQGNYSGESLKGFIESPSDRKQVVGALMDAVGAKMIDFYITTGEYDFLLIAEAGSMDDMIQASVIAGSSGNITNLKTVQALSSADFKACMERAGAARDKFVASASG